MGRSKNLNNRVSVLIFWRVSLCYTCVGFCCCYLSRGVHLYCTASCRVKLRYTVYYSKHPHIRTLILEVRLIRFLYIGCLVKNQPEGVLKLFLKIGGGNQNCNKYTKKSLRLN